MSVLPIWLAIAGSEEVGHHLLACEAGKHRLVVFRRQDGKPTALKDECWHRMLPLSNGRLVGDDVVCAYHGLVFNSEGRCTRARVGPAPAGATIQSYPATDAAGLVWVLITIEGSQSDRDGLGIGALRSRLPGD